MLQFAFCRVLKLKEIPRSFIDLFEVPCIVVIQGMWCHSSGNFSTLHYSREVRASGVGLGNAKGVFSSAWLGFEP